jgi:putative glutamine amidotransferase
MSTRPRIAVTGPDKGGFPAWVFTALAVRRAGGSPLRLRPGKFPRERPLPAFDGLILGGGADIEPEKAGTAVDKLFQSPGEVERRSGRLMAWLLAPLVFLFRLLFSRHRSEVDATRDAFEERCLAAALDAGLPVLGICRGAQLINIHFDGNLHGDLSAFYGERGNPDSLYPRKAIQLHPDSRLKAILQVDSLMVNSLHQQAVDQLGNGIRVAARDHSGVVQAIEVHGRPFLIGVQWHPEYLPTVAVQQRLFRRLVQCGKAPPSV